MSAAGAKTWSWLASGAMALVACGCSPTGSRSVDSLPWSNTSVLPVATGSPGGPGELALEMDAAARTSAAELEFRDRIVQAHIDDLRRIAAHPPLVRAVKKANESGWQTQEQIEQTDLRWRQTPGVDDPLIKSYLKNPSADFLRKEQQANPSYMEIFVMDNQGCIVAESDKTSDFWQGDEPKWQECFNNGNGRIHVGDVEYDQSTSLCVIQISTPIYDENNATIGAMTASVSSNQRD